MLLSQVFAVPAVALPVEESRQSLFVATFAKIWFRDAVGVTEIPCPALSCTRLADTIDPSEDTSTPPRPPPNSALW